ncbi:MAG TPA: primosomal protein N', partial [Thermodesulfobacteriota bacterium]|nr:primosomal protein N' [Thermodesulfobacteriota bacterium]
MSPKHYVDVALPLPLRKTFTYEVPAELQAQAAPGRRVVVPFGKRARTGLILGPASVLPAQEKILAVREVMDETVSVPQALLKLLVWAAGYYLQPLGKVISAALPAGSHPRSREVFFLTPAGAEAIERSSPDPPSAQILNELKERGERGAPLSSLSRKFSFPLRPPLEKMRSLGWVGKRDEFGKQPRAQSVKWVRLAGKADEPPVSPRQREILDFLRERGEAPLSELKERFPASPLALLRQRGLLEIILKETFRTPSFEDVEDWADGPPALLSGDQQKALDEIAEAVDARRFQPFLLHGITGSGKTEVYLRAIQRVLSKGRRALLLVPEIALTAQLVAYLRSRVEHPTAVLHSGLSAGERLDEWRRTRSGDVKLVIGVRSAVFAPLEDLGAIIVDEEHDPSYKQEETVRYNARDLAVMRGKMENAVVILGSATPSLESYRNALENKFRLLRLPCRIDGKTLPAMEILDMRGEGKEAKGRPVFSRALENAVRENAERGQQTLLFLNRRGYSTFSLCRECGFTYKCPNCSVSLTFHVSDKSLRCHYCEYSIRGADACPQCASRGLMLFGIGTQRLEEEIKEKFPAIAAARMDRDTTSAKSAHQKILGRMRRGEVNVLIGTQMIAKGHNLPRVTLVGVLAADLSLNLPDFRAAERTFQLLTQVAGRAGRGDLPGRVIVQTYNPEHYSILMAKSQDYHAFYLQETEFRRAMGYPPYCRIVNLRWEGNSESGVRKFSRGIEEIARDLLGHGNRDIEALGPSAAPLSRLKGKFRCLMLFKGREWAVLHRFAARIAEKAETEIAVPGVKLIID